LAEFDAQAVLDAVDAGTIPSGWQVYRAMRGYLAEWGSGFWLLALLFVLMGATLIALFILAPPSPQTWDEDPQYFLVLLAASCMLLAGLCIWQGAILLRQIRSAPKQALVLTPEGFVVRMGPQAMIPIANSSIISPVRDWAGARGGMIFSVTYAAMVSADLHIEPGGYESQINLILTFVAPRRIVFWRVDPRFPSRDTIAQSIIEAHMRYKAQHSEAQ
jgi:hypothetical protein